MLAPNCLCRNLELTSKWKLFPLVIVIVVVLISIISYYFYYYYYKSQPPYQVEKGSARGWCVRRGNLLQDRLPVKLQERKFKDPKFNHEIFVRIDMKHSYFSNYYVTCLQSILYCLLFAKNLIMLMHTFCSCYK